MREMRSDEFLEKRRTPLVVKGSLPRAFLSLGVFAEIGLLFLGSYLLTQAIMKPLQANSATVIGGGVLLSLASVLMFYLLSPGRPDSLSRRDRDLELEEDGEGNFIDVNARAIPEGAGAVSASGSTMDSISQIETVRFHAAGKAGR